MKSVKANTRVGRIKGIAPVHYKVTDSTRIRHLETKKILASIETKRELTRYLADKLAPDLEKDLVVVFDRSCFSNLDDLEESLKTYDKKKLILVSSCIQEMCVEETHLLSGLSAVQIQMFF